MLPVSKQDRLLEPPIMCCSNPKTTDAGPGEGITNTEVRLRDSEVACIHSSDRVTESIMLQGTLLKIKQREQMQP